MWLLYNLRFFLTVLILFLSCSTHPENVFGCTDSSACNFNPNANEDDGSCVYVADMCGICDNDSTNDCIQDCAGNWGGNTPTSDCEICIINSGEFDCSGNCCVNDLIYNIDSLIYTDTSCSIEDQCGVCNGEGWNDGLSCNDIFILKQIIAAGDFSIQQSLQNETTFHNWDYNANGVIDFNEFGEQKWSEEGRLTYLKVDIPIILTEDIGGLTELRELILETSKLTAIPETIGNLQKLEVLNLTSNSISLLPESILNLLNLKKLLISNNNLIELPENIGDLTSLSRFDVANNTLITIPESIGSLINLQYLFLENNQINVLPTTFADLSSLIELKLNNNKLAAIPESFGVFGELQQLYLNNNQLRKLPEDFGKMNNLKILYLNDNKLASLPENIGSMMNLLELWLHRNQLFSLPDEIGALDSLVTLKIDNNLLQSIPESVGSLESLKALSLDNNELISLPESLCNIYDGFELFSVSNNNLCPGSFPTCISASKIENQVCLGCPPSYFLIEGYCAWESDYNILQYFLDLNPESQSLPFSTGIPELASECVNEDWWHGGRLVEITFQHKQLYSIIPENIGNLDKLEIIRLTGNTLTGEIPDNMMNLNNLIILKLSSNSLSGNIPENIGELTNLDTLDLDNNNFIGIIPSSITELELSYLDLNDNDISGTIPENIGDMTSLTHLYLHRNELSGAIPQSIGNLDKIKQIYLFQNLLSGQIPENICTIYLNNENAMLILDANQLCPPYPECITAIQLGLTIDNVINQDTTACELR